MKLRSRKALAIQAMLVAALTAVAPAHAETGVTDGEIKLGAFGALSGPFAFIGKGVYDGVETVYREVNAAGGIHGRKIMYVREDDRCSPADAVAAVKKLVHEHKVFMIHGGDCSNASVAAKPEIVAANIPWVIASSTVDSLTDPVHPLIFSTMTAAWMDVYAQLDHALKSGAKRIAIVAQRDVWGNSRRTALLKTLEARKIALVADEELAGDATDASAQVLRLQQAKPDAVIALLFPRAGVVYLRDAQKFSFKPLTIGPPPMSDIDLLVKQVGNADAVANVVGLGPVGAVPEDPALQKWRDLVAKHFPGSKFNIYHMLGIASGQFVVEALKRSGRDVTRAKIAAVMPTLSVATETLGGPLACRTGDHQCHRTLTMFGLKNGKSVVMGSITLGPRKD